MPATFKPVLNFKPKADGTYTILIRITKDRKTKYAGTNYSINPKHWNDKATYDRANWVRSSYPLHAIYNSGIKSMIDQARLLDEKDNLSAEQIQKRLKGIEPDNAQPEEPSFITYFEQQNAAQYKLIMARQANGEKKTLRAWEKNENILSKLKSFLNDRDLKFSELTVKFIRDYETWLLTTPQKRTGKPNKRNTVSKNLSFLNTMIRKAVADEMMPFEKNPFLKLNLSYEPVRKEKLNKLETEQLEAVELKPGSRLEHARDTYLFQFYTAGTRIADTIQLTWANIVGGRLVYGMDKTGKQMTMKLVPKALDILKKYEADKKPNCFVFPWLSNDKDYSDINYLMEQIESKTSQINGLLKELAKKVGITKNLSTHISRHSFANQARAATKDIYGVSKALGHANTKITEAYLASFDEDSVDDVLDNVFQ